MEHTRAPRRHWSQLRARASRAEFLDAEREGELLRAAQRGDASAIASLVASHMRLVVEIAAHYARGGLEPDELVSEGTLGLLEAIKRYDARRDARLATYARWWIRARVNAFARRQRSLVSPPSTRLARRIAGALTQVERELGHRLGREPSRAELAAALQTSEQELAWLTAANGRDTAVDDLPRHAEPRVEEDGPEQALARQELQRAAQQRLRAAVAQLSRRERKIFATQFPEARCTHGELGQQLGVSRQRASQLVAQLREHLRHHLANLAS